MITQTKNLDLVQTQFKFNDENGTFTGYGSTFNNIDSYKDTILPGAYDNIIKEDKNPLMFFNHAAYEVPIGVWTSMKQDDTGLLLEGKLLEGHSKATDVRAAMKANAVSGLSIGYGLTKQDYEVVDGIRNIKNISQLHEVSVVTFPADDYARIDINTVKAAINDFNSLKEYEHYLRDVGGFSNAGVKTLISGIKRALRDEEQIDEIAHLLKTFKLKN